MSKKVLLATFILFLVLIIGKSSGKSKMEAFYDASYKQWKKIGSITGDMVYITKNYRNTYGLYAQGQDIFAKGKLAIKGNMMINIQDQCILKDKKRIVQYSTTTKKGHQNNALGFNIIDWYDVKAGKNSKTNPYTFGTKTSKNGYGCMMIYKQNGTNIADRNEYCISEKYGIAVYLREKRGKDFVIINIGNIHETQVDNNLFEIPNDIKL